MTVFLNYYYTIVTLMAYFNRDYHKFCKNTLFFKILFFGSLARAFCGYDLDKTAENLEAQINSL